MKNKIILGKIKVFFIAIMLFFCTIASAQNSISLQLKDVTVKTALDKLKDKSTYSLWYNSDDIDLNKRITVDVKNAEIRTVLNLILDGQNLSYSINGKQVVIQKRKLDNKVEKVTGVVYDAKGSSPIPGAAIIVKGSNEYTYADNSGRYEINVPIGTIIEVSMIGYKPIEYLVSSAKPLNFYLSEAVIALNEIVVTGFQTISRERSTGSAVIINQENLNKIQSTNLSSKLEGSVAGLSTYNGSMSIRGTSSFAISSTPLIVVDGQPVTGITINDINPEDIRSITVLKDAAATSLYGVRASNGVIVVTTKKGDSKEVSINVSAGFYFTPLPSLSYQHYATTSQILDYEIDYLTNNPSYIATPKGYFDNLNSMDAPQTLSQVEYLYYRMANGEISQQEVDSKISQLQSNDYRKEYRKVMQQMNFTQDYNVSLSKGDENSNIFFSSRFQDIGSYDKNHDNKKISLYFKNELPIAKWLKFTYGVNLTTGANKYSFPNISGATSTMPYDKIFNSDGSTFYIYPYNYVRAQMINEDEGLKFMGYNVYEDKQQNSYKAKDLYWKAFGQADIKIIEGLDFSLKFQYEDRRQDYETYNKEEGYYMRSLINRFASNSANGGYDYNIPLGGHLSETHDRYAYMNLRGQLDYKKTFGKKHEFTALAGGEIREDKYRRTRGERYGYDEQKLTFVQVDYATLSNGVLGQLNNMANTFSEVVGVNDTKHRYISAYMNAAYSYDARYALNASVRVEQADLFGTDPKYRYRPLWSVGASWNLNNEKFMSGAKSIDMLKLRITYGITGNVDQSSSPYLLGIYITSPYSNSNLTDIITPPNKYLRWEKTSTFNAGLDFVLFKNFSGSADFYKRYSSDLLALKSLDPSTGFESGRVNNGAMKNTGFEIVLSYDWANTKDWNFATSFTASYNSNKITKVGYIPTDAQDMMMHPTSNYLKGDVFNSLYAYKYAGLSSEGNPSIYDQDGEIVSNGSPVRDIAALVCTGQLDPKWSGAFDLSLRYKQLNLYAKVVYYAGHSLRADAVPLYSGATNGGMKEDIADRWTPNNTNTDIPSMNEYGNSGDRDIHWRYSDYNVVSASFIKMRNIGIQYLLPAKVVRKCGMKSVSLKGQVNNPFFWASNDRGIDPEAFNANEGTRTQQQVTSYTLGLNINF